MFGLTTEEEIVYEATRPVSEFRRRNEFLERAFDRLGIRYAVASNGQEGRYPGAAAALTNAILAIVAAPDCLTPFRLIPPWRRPWDPTPLKDFLREYVDLIVVHCEENEGGPVYLEGRTLHVFQHQCFYFSVGQPCVYWAQMLFATMIADYMWREMSVTRWIRFASHDCHDLGRFRRVLAAYIYNHPRLLEGVFPPESTQELLNLAGECFQEPTESFFRRTIAKLLMVAKRVLRAAQRILLTRNH